MVFLWTLVFFLFFLKLSIIFGIKKAPAELSAGDEVLLSKNEMTLDCFILRSSAFLTTSDHPQSRVISVRSWYLTSFNLSFYRFDSAFFFGSSVFFTYYHDLFLIILFRSSFFSALSVKARSVSAFHSLPFSSRFFSALFLICFGTLPLLFFVPVVPVDFAFLLDLSSGMNSILHFAHCVWFELCSFPSVRSSVLRSSFGFSGSVHLVDRFFSGSAFCFPCLLSGYIIMHIYQFFKPAFYTNYKIWYLCKEEKLPRTHWRRFWILIYW